METKPNNVESGCPVCEGVGEVYVTPNAFASKEDEANFDYTCPTCKGSKKVTVECLEDEMRRYGKSAYRPDGSKEKKERCIAEVPNGARTVTFHQCRNVRGFGPDGLYCSLHAKRLADGKNVFVPDNE